ncbi:MAG: hypothetical protein GTO53_11980 [Planctomycetales bacterium]|nr:hypothetical protein [Planctomycetales bacterium]NIM09828.1 hypothetical protein [Planctomycetales bacterium]NIN09672.1 hypothetical protein [Planctomycetales bacterium]NIN78787.1 hypothetical protein [Planctomycetales bacterium]NIO35963.1 hypothetical protein [Planctomycetales bacterium]
MTPQETVIDEIVRRVLQQLSDGGEKRCTADDQLSLPERVITTTLLKERLQGARRLKLAPGAVITPAARDLLNQYQVDVHTDRGPQDVPATPLAIGMDNAQPSLAPLQDMLKRAGTVTQWVEAGQLPEMVQQLGNHVISQQGLAVLLTQQAAAALCLANRRAGLRAVEAEDVPSMRRAVTAVGANLLVINPRGLSSASVVRVVTNFATGGPYVCPEPLQSVLE